MTYLSKPKFPDCYWLDFFMIVSVGSLSPEITIPFTFEAYFMGHDAAMHHILETFGSDSGTRLTADRTTQYTPE